jgi:hypothetical protein
VASTKDKPFVQPDNDVDKVSQNGENTTPPANNKIPPYDGDKTCLSGILREDSSSKELGRIQTEPVNTNRYTGNGWLH